MQARFQLDRFRGSQISQAERIRSPRLVSQFVVQPCVASNPALEDTTVHGGAAQTYWVVVYRRVLLQSWRFWFPTF